MEVISLQLLYKYILPHVHTNWPFSCLASKQFLWSLLTPKEAPSMTIKSDASLQGWGATYNGNQTRGPWSPSEQSLHISCLELLAATLAVQTFAKEQSGQPSVHKLSHAAFRKAKCNHSSSAYFVAFRKSI